MFVSDLPEIEVSITVLGDPIIGNTVNLVCNATITSSNSAALSTADLILRWFYNDSLIEPDDSLNISYTSDQLVLTLESVDRDLNGLYSCNGTLTIESVATPLQDIETYNFIAIGNLFHYICPLSTIIVSSRCPIC